MNNWKNEIIKNLGGRENLKKKINTQYIMTEAMENTIMFDYGKPEETRDIIIEKSKLGIGLKVDIIFLKDMIVEKTIKNISIDDIEEAVFETIKRKELI